MVRLAITGLLLVLAACNGRDPQSIVFAVASAPTVLDPRLASDAASERVNALLFDRLVVLDDRGEPVAQMGRWQQLGPRHYRVELVPERRAFADGRQPDAHDVVATYQSVLDPALASPHRGGLAHIESIVAVDPSTVDFSLSRDDPLFPLRLTIGILPAAQARQTDAVETPRGSGAFAFQRRSGNGRLELRRRSDGQRLVIEQVADPTMRTLKLLRGEADLVQNDLPPEMVAYLADRPAVELTTRPGTTFAYLGFNMADPILARRQVRAAVAHAIDRDAIIRHLFGGRAEKAESVLRPGHWAGVGDMQPFGFDPETSRRLLAEAGFGPANPLNLVYKTSTDPLRLRIAHVFQQQLADVGIRLEIASYDWGTFFGDIKAGRFQLYSLAWVGVNSPDILRYAFHSASRPPAGANRGRYHSVVVDRLVEEAEKLQAAQAAVLLREAQRQVHDDLVYVPLWYEANVAVSGDVSGFAPGFDGNYLALQRVMKRDGH